MNVAIRNRNTDQVIVRYQIHLGDASSTPPAEKYFDEAWSRAVSEQLVDAEHRADYAFHIQNPKTLYESAY